MFSQKDFIEATRDFVCIRIESFESKENQDLVRSFLGGRFANTAFCVLSPDGKDRLSRSGRGPSALLGRMGGPVPANGDERMIKDLGEIAKRYRAKGKAEEANLQDFDAFRQALNISSGDQRLLVYVNVSGDKREAAEKKLKPVLNDPGLVGRFHVDFAEAKTDEGWDKAVGAKRASSKDGSIYVIKPGTFGLEGKVIEEIPMSAKAEAMKSELQAANKAFAEEEERKVYSQHVSQGRRQGVYFENAMPYGEDRDGDGQIDQRGGGRGGPAGGGRGGRPRRGRP